MEPPDQGSAPCLWRANIKPNAGNAGDCIDAVVTKFIILQRRMSMRQAAEAAAAKPQTAIHQLLGYSAASHQPMHHEWARQLYTPELMNSKVQNLS